MKTAIHCCSAALVLCAANFFLFAQSDETIDTAQSIGKDIFVYHSSGEQNQENPAENILVIRTKAHVVVVGTPEDLVQTIKLLNWITSRINKPIALVIATRAHADRLGGISVLLNDKFPIYGSAVTAQEAVRNGFRRPDHVFGNDTVFCCDSVRLETFYPGPGCTNDNLTVYLPGSEILYGGCFLRSASAASLQTADTAQARLWLKNLGKLKEKYPRAKIVVPSSGGWESGAIERTEELLQKILHPRKEK